jgi:2-dehydro-3-deoxygluconokinase
LKEGGMMQKMVGFGDFMLRLNPEGYLRFIQAERFEVNYTGAEANVCVSLSRFGIPTEFVTKLPDNAIADAGISMLRKYNVGTSHIVFGGERMGVFYAEKGASQRASLIVYDRTHTSIATCRFTDFDWDAIFDGATHFHITGITPALSPTMPEVCIMACKKAKEKGLVISCDLNYRKKLWSEQQAKSCMTQIMPFVDILVANEEDADKVLGIHASGSDVIQGKLDHEGYVDVARQITATYGTKMVAITLRKSISASDNEWGAMLYTDGKPYFSRNYVIHLVDRIGGGDSFSAGLLYGVMNVYDPQMIIEFAASASCLKQSMEMDFNLATVPEVLSLVCGDGSGRVRR